MNDPNKMKMAKDVPIYKSDDKHNFNHYRPISVLSTSQRLYKYRKMYPSVHLKTLLINTNCFLTVNTGLGLIDQLL